MSAVESEISYSEQPAHITDLNDRELREIISQVGELPNAVQQLQFTQTFRRVFDASTFAAATSQQKTSGTDDEWALRLQRRGTSLTPYIGQYLICVLIRLPGVYYTIEVDPGERRVVHWEWQST